MHECTSAYIHTRMYMRIRLYSEHTCNTYTCTYTYTYTCIHTCNGSLETSYGMTSLHATLMTGAGPYAMSPDFIMQPHVTQVSHHALHLQVGSVFFLLQLEWVRMFARICFGSGHNLWKMWKVSTYLQDLRRWNRCTHSNAECTRTRIHMWIHVFAYSFTGQACAPVSTLI
jgi:hypothetical protein